MRIDPATGALSVVGKQAVLPGRAVHMTLDATDRYAVVAYNNPPGATTHAIAVMARWSPRLGRRSRWTSAITRTRFASALPTSTWWWSRAARALAMPGMLRHTRRAEGGVLRRRQTEDARLHRAQWRHQLRSRHLDFHPTRPWVYVSLELENKLHMFGLNNDQFSPDPLFVRETLVNPAFVAPSQMAGTIHVHPNGKTVYLINRANGTAEFEGRPFYAGGDNTMAVYSINQQTGEPTLIQSEDTRGMHARTFSIEPTGPLLVAAHNNAVEVRNNSSIGSHIVPGGLSVFRVQDDGRLEFPAQGRHRHGQEEPGVLVEDVRHRRLGTERCGCMVSCRETSLAQVPAEPVPGYKSEVRPT